MNIRNKFIIPTLFISIVTFSIWAVYMVSDEKKKLLDEIQLGKKADYYYGLSLFALNKFLHAPFLSLNTHRYNLFDR